MKPQFVLASRNQKKLKELSNILEGLGIELLPLPDDAPEPVEDGETFEDNALIKARSAAKFTGMAAIADDSGLCVDSLEGAPGVYSARYGSKAYFDYAGRSGLKVKGNPLRAGADDRERTLFLLQNMSEVPDDERGAKFVCAAACVTPGGGTITVCGECEGCITKTLIGEGGFGYDPVFYVPEYKCTFGELPPEIKNTVSHRAKALKKMKKILLGLL